MAERVPRPATNDNIGWNTTPTNPSTDPGAAVRAAGWAVNAIPGSDEFNYIQTMLGDNAIWIEGFAAREWADISEGVANAAAWRDLFRVVPPVGGIMWTRLQQMWVVAGSAATGGTPNQLCTDAEQIYYVAGGINQSLIAASPINGSEIWEAAPLTQHDGLCADGNYLYTTSPISPAEIGLTKVDRTNGGFVARGGTEYSCSKLRTNGVYCVGVSPAGTAGRLVFWTVGVGAAAPVETGVATPSTALVAVAIDADQCYVGGTRNTNDIWAYTLSSRASKWSVTLDTNAPTVNAVEADGNCVYVGTDRFATAAGPQRNVFCLDRTTGALLWSIDVGAVDIDDLAVDDRYLYAMDNGGTVHQIDLHASVSSVVATGGSFAEIVSDGVSLIGRDAGTASNFRRNATMGATKLFTIASGDDPARRPFYTLAIPVSQGS